MKFDYFTISKAFGLYSYKLWEERTICNLPLCMAKEVIFLLLKCSLELIVLEPLFFIQIDMYGKHS